jgi:hypothetical protein
MTTIKQLLQDAQQKSADIKKLYALIEAVLFIITGRVSLEDAAYQCYQKVLPDNILTHEKAVAEIRRLGVLINTLINKLADCYADLCVENLSDELSKFLLCNCEKGSLILLIDKVLKLVIDCGENLQYELSIDDNQAKFLLTALLPRKNVTLSFSHDKKISICDLENKKQPIIFNHHAVKAAAQFTLGNDERAALITALQGVVDKQSALNN